jgi:hypothetical protein
MCPSAAFAVDWSLSSTQSETVELNNNEFLRTMLAGGTLGSYSTITTNATANTPTSLFTFDGDINYRKYWGGLDPGQQSESLSGGFRMHYETKHKDKNDKDYLDASWHRQSTAFALLGELGVVVPTTGFLDRTGVGGGIERSITNTDFVSASAHSTYTSYDPGTGGTPFTDTSASGTWRHQVNSIAALSASSDGDYLSFENTLGSKLTILRENVGLDLTLSRLLSFRGTAGVAFTQSENGSTGLSLTPQGTTSPSSSGWTAGPIFNLLLTYKMYQDTTVTLAAMQSISPTLVGSLIQNTSVQAGLSHNVNSRTTVSFATSASQVISAGTSTDLLSASMTYSYLLTRQWTTQLTYRYLQRLASSGTPSASIDSLTGIPITPGLGAASSNSLMVVVSHSINILPDGN